MVKAVMPVPEGRKVMQLLLSSRMRRPWRVLVVPSIRSVLGQLVSPVNPVTCQGLACQLGQLVPQCPPYNSATVVCSTP